MNRVQIAIDKTRTVLQSLNGVGKDGTPLDEVDRKQALTFDEHFAFQQQQALAHASGQLSSEEAMLIYQALGEGYYGDGWTPGTDLATKIVVTKVIGELMGVI